MALALPLPKDRVAAAAGAALFHLLLGYLLILGLRGDFAAEPAAESLKLISLRELPPPPPVVSIPDKPTQSAEGAAAPPSRKANPSPVVASRTPLPVPPVLPTVDKPVPVPPGSAASAGVASVDGGGSGTGGEGAGSGSGGSGDGSGGGGARPAQRIGGALANRDYPRAALHARAEGSVAVRFTIRADGRVGDCRIIRSSGHAELDDTTCRLIEKRFRYRPALGRSGRPVAASEAKTFDWYLPPAS
ncbi:MAG TPA: TonB family protein [Allosphingosinicella sp.]|jgi:protein TonB